MSQQDWTASIQEFQEMTRKFYAKEISVKDYKGFSGFFGSYAQRGGNASMLRLRMAGGQLTKERLAFLTSSIRSHQINKVHFTTCQTVQLHNLDEKAVCALVPAALDHGIIVLGGGGDFPRNVMASPLSGVEQGEYFDVLPCVQKAADYLLSLLGNIKMPRKLKVGFSNSPANATHATFRDLGFAARPDGAFDVYAAGGLGNNPRMGLKVAEGVQPSKILYYIQAMVDTFIAHGNYENRAKARTRYMQESLGEEGFRQAFGEKLQAVLEMGNLDVAIEPQPVQKTGSGELAGPRVLAQKQPGLYAVQWHPIGGSPAPEQLIALEETIRDMDQVEVRLAPDETAYIINLTAAEAEKVLAVTEGGARTLFERSVACIGASICQVGARDSQSLMERLVEMAREKGFADGVLPCIHISGCTSSCGTHQIGALGFHGGVKSMDGKPQPAFTLHIGGEDGQGQEQFGTVTGVILEQDIPGFLADLGELVQSAGTTYDVWIKDHKKDLLALANNKYLV